MTSAGTLAAAETAAPVESLDVVARMLKERLGAASVSFLITDFTDVYQWGRRTIPLSLAAEIQHRLLPASLAATR